MQHTRLLRAIGEQRRSYNFTSARLIALSSLNVGLTYGVLTIMESSVICYAITGLLKLFLASACNRNIKDLETKYLIVSEHPKVSSRHHFLLIHLFQGTPSGCSFALCIHSESLNLYLPIFIGWKTNVCLGGYCGFHVSRHKNCV